MAASFPPLPHLECEFSHREQCLQGSVHILDGTQRSVVYVWSVREPGSYFLLCWKLALWSLVSLHFICSQLLCKLMGTRTVTTYSLWSWKTVEMTSICFELQKNLLNILYIYIYPDIYKFRYLWVHACVWVILFTLRKRSSKTNLSSLGGPEHSHHFHSLAT